MLYKDIKKYHKIRGYIKFLIYNNMIENKICKWCDKEIVDLRSDAIFCRRACKNMYKRAKKNKKNKDVKEL